ncbi:MAG: NAD(+)/NADH kinase [Planctomycetota bacterium]
MTLRALLVYKRSTLEMLRRAGRLPGLRAKDPSFVRRLERSDLRHKDSLRVVKRELLSRRWQVSEVHRAGLTSAQGAQLVVSVGGDGTFLEAARVAGDVPVVSVNSDPVESVAHFSACEAKGFGRLLDRWMDGTLSFVRLRRLEVRGSFGNELVLNDALLAHRNPAAATRLLVRLGGKTSEIKGSGLWVSTAAGSPAAARSSGGLVLPALSRRWQVVFRETYTPRGLVKRLLLGPRDHFKVVNRSEDAWLYLDGSHRRVSVGAGETLVFRPSGRDVLAVWPSQRRRLG